MNKIDIAFKDHNEVNPFFKHYDTIEDWWKACKDKESELINKPLYIKCAFHQMNMYELFEQDLMLKKDLNKF